MLTMWLGFIYLFIKGDSALMIACEFQKIAMAMLLIAAGAGSAEVKQFFTTHVCVLFIHKQQQ